MVQLRRNADGSRTWLMEGETLPERLREIATIFSYHADKNHEVRLDHRFTAELLAMQTADLVRLAEEQERELRALREAVAEFTVFKAEILAALKELKEPDNKALDKPRFPAPATARKQKNGKTP
jgi:hypothetical protein